MNEKTIKQIEELLEKIKSNKVIVESMNINIEAQNGRLVSTNETVGFKIDFSFVGYESNI